MKRRAPSLMLLALLAAAAGVAALLLMAPTSAPGGGMPSRPRFLSLGVGGVAPTSDGAAINYGTAPRADLQETDAAANNQDWSIQAASEQLRWRACNAPNSGCTNFLTVDRTGNTIDALDLLATAVTVNGTPITASSGTFTGSYATACTTTPTTDYKWSKVGNIVTLMNTTTVSCTSDSTSFGLDAGSLPAAIRPAANQCVVGAGGVNNAANVSVIMRIETGGGINFSNGIGGSSTACSATNWTASGTKGLSQFSVTYSVQ